MANIDLICACCRKGFKASPNSLYCSIRCRKKVGKDRENFKEHIKGLETFLTAEIEALDSLDYNEVRKMRAKQQMFIHKIDCLHDIPAIRNDWKLEIQWESLVDRATSLKRKEPRLTVSVTCLWERYNEIKENPRKLPLDLP